jgi:DNA polymerase phi
MNQLSVDDRYLHDMAIKAANVIHLRASRHPDFAPPAIKGLLGPNGSANFDHLTKTKTVNKIVGEASPSALQPIVSLLERLIARPGSTDSQTATSSRRFMANLLLSIVRSRSASCDDFQGAIEGVLSVLLRFAYFKGTTNEPPEPQVTEKIRETFRSTLSSSLNSIIGNCTDATQIVYSTVRNIRESMATGIFGDSIIELDDGIVESIDKSFNSLKKLSKNVS